MTLAAVQGQDRALETLRSALTRGKVHHAYLFEGPDGVGKELTARGFVQALLCQAQAQQGCGTCDVCARVEKGHHPDVHWVMPEDTAVARGLKARSDFDHVPSRDLRVEQVRQLQERLALRPLESARQICVLVDAQQLNERAQNAFLKTLEEPPAGALLILISSASDKLLPTLKSRLARVPFGALPRAQIVQHLIKTRKLSETDAQRVSAMAQGSLARAEALDPDAISSQEEIIRSFEALVPTDPRAWLRFADAQGGSRDEAEHALEVLMQWTRDVLVTGTGTGTGTLTHLGLESVAQDAARRHPPGQLHRRYRLLDEARVNVTTKNAGARLQLERLLVQLYGGAA